MAVNDSRRENKKRKQKPDEEGPFDAAIFSQIGDLELSSDEESQYSDEHLDDLPVIDVASDSDGDGDEDGTNQNNGLYGSSWDSDEDVPRRVRLSKDDRNRKSVYEELNPDDSSIHIIPLGSGNDSEESEVDSDDEDSSTPRLFPEGKMVISNITGQNKKVYPEIEPEYDSDSSTEETSNRVGDIPMHWYDDLPHIGYDVNGRKVLRPAKGDELDKFLATVEDPSTWTSAFDVTTQMDKPLTTDELDIIRRLYAGENPDATYDPFEPSSEWFTGKGKEEVMPLSAAPEPKRRWVPSKWEKKKVMKIVRAIRQGRIIPSKPKKSAIEFYSIWSEPPNSHLPPLPAPKVRLPTNSESYNPPEEYLPSERERDEWAVQDPEDREREYLPQKYSSLRLVPAYESFIKERFHRQLDLYLAPRVQRKKLNMDPEALIPKLPSPNSLKPFPNYKSLQITHSESRIRCVSVSPDGAWVISGGEDGVVSLWEVNVGRVVKRWKFSKIGALEWCPRTDVSFFVVGIEETLHFLIPPNIPHSVLLLTQALLSPNEMSSPPAVTSPVKWTSKPINAWSTETPILTLTLTSPTGLPSQISWHRRGDYLTTVSGNGSQTNVWIHQITRRHSQAPFKKVKGVVQMVLFHPLKPHLFVATQHYVRIYNLAEQKLLKTLLPGIRWISSMDIHPSGDHLIVGGYDRKLCWFDLELSDKPYKVLRYHSRAIRSLQFHQTYPLFASSSDDGSIQIFHARVYNDLMTDPLVVPLKILRGHEIKDGLGVLQVKWVPDHPWLISGGADGKITVWCS